MPDFAGEVSFERAAEILEISYDALEQLLDTGVLRGYRRGDDIVFRRQDLAGFITSSGAAKAVPQGTGGGQRPSTPRGGGRGADVAAPSVQPRRPDRAKRDDLKKAAMGQGGAGDGMFSLKRQAMERGVVDGGARKAGPQAIPSPVAGMPSGEEPSPPAGPSPVAGMPTNEPAAPPAPGPAPGAPAAADAQRLAAENESLRARLQAAEEVLNDLQRRCESTSGLESRNQTLKNQLKMLQTSLVQLEAKVVAYEDMESVESEGRRWGAPDPEERAIALRREAAELRGEMAAMKHRVESAEKDAQRYKNERDELETKLRSAKESQGGRDSALVEKLEKELESRTADLESLSAERDMLAIEAEAAKELRGEIERASELEEKLNTQHEVIEAAQERLEQLENERDELEKKARALEEKAAAAESGEGKVTELSEKLAATEQELDAHKKKAMQMEARVSTLRAERDGLTEELENRDDELAHLRAERQKGEAASEEMDKLKVELSEVRAKAEAAEVAMHEAQAQVSLKDQLIEQFRTEEREQSDLETDNTRLREKLAESQSKAKQAEARMTAIRAERDGLTSELAKVQGGMDELRSQAERASALLGDNRTLKRDLEAARVRTAELESTLEMKEAEREKLTAEFDEAKRRADELKQRLDSQERDLGTIAARVETAPGDDRLRKELEALRSEIAGQMKELGQVRAQGEAASMRRTRSAEGIAKRSRRGSLRRRALPLAGSAGKPKSLGRFQVGEEVGRSRSGIRYRSSLPSTGKPIDILALPAELARDRRFLDNFWREMRVVAELEHENLLGVIDVGESEGIQYVAYEHVEGETLEAALRKEEKLEPAPALDITRGIVAGLIVAAKNNITHGDLKPENVMLSADGRLKLAGLGLARGAEDDASSLNARGRIEHYGAPEQILGKERDARSDIYSAGAILYRMLTGDAPLEAGSISEVRGLVEVSELPRPDGLTQLSEGLRHVLAKALAEKPDDRYQSLANFASALKKVKP